MASKAVPHEKYSLRGGPLAGQTVLLARGDHTLPICMKGVCGRYQWVDGNTYVLHWQVDTSPRPAQLWLPSLHPEPPDPPRRVK